jgi:hypothetical protein
LAAPAAALALLATVSASAQAHPDSSELDDGVAETGGVELTLPWGHGDAHDEEPTNPTLPDTLGATGSQTIDVVGRGLRNDVGATTDVWSHDGYAYTGTFNDPCGGNTGAGIWVWDVSNANDVDFVTVIPSPTGSRTNDVRVAAMNSGDSLVHSNESCGGGPGGFEVYDVDDPANPVYLASVRIDELNPTVEIWTGPVRDVGVHNLFLFSQGSSDYVAVTSEGWFDNFRIYDITDPATPSLLSSWGAEEINDPGVSDSNDPSRVLSGLLDLLGGFGASQNKFLDDVTMSADGTMAYLANWDAGLVLLDVSDPADPALVSVAIDPVNGSLDGEVNSHSVWPSEDGSIVIEGEEDFSAWEASVPPSNLTADGTATPGDPTTPVTAIATAAGDYFEANATGLTGTVHASSISVDGGPEFPAIEMSNAPGAPTLADTGDISGNIVFVGRACGLTQGDVLTNPVGAGDIAIVRRGACEFDEKAQTVAAAGAAVAVIANNNPTSTPWSDCMQRLDVREQQLCHGWHVLVAQRDRRDPWQQGARLHRVVQRRCRRARHHRPVCPGRGRPVPRDQRGRRPQRLLGHLQRAQQPVHLRIRPQRRSVRAQDEGAGSPEHQLIPSTNG